MAQPAATATTGSTAVQPQTPKKPMGPVFKVASGPARWADERVGLAGLSRPFLRKVFPDHWSFLLGEVALYSFIILLLTGVFLTIWFKPSMAEIEYEGTCQLLAARRPAVGNRPAVRGRADPLDPDHRHLGRVLRVCRGVPGRPDHPAA